MKVLTPMMQQYQDIKKEYADCILFFRLGDFYEMFFEDALLASRELDIVLTSRDGGSQKVPMCGVPYHAAASYIGKLLARGYKVAICEQVEDPRSAKGLVKREVVQVITPGTVLDEAWLGEDNNYLASLFWEEERVGLAYVDVSTGEFACCQIESSDLRGELENELRRIRASEYLVPDFRDKLMIGPEMLEGMGPVTKVEPDWFSWDRAWRALERKFGAEHRSLEELKDVPCAVRAAGAILAFLDQTQKSVMPQIDGIKVYQIRDYMGIDGNTRRNLELTSSIIDGTKNGTLFEVLDMTVTAMGKRKLRSWLERPLLSKSEIESRLDAVEELYRKSEVRENLREGLKEIRDIERTGARIGAQVAGPRELLALAAGLRTIGRLKAIGEQVQSQLLQQLFSLSEIREARELIEEAIDEEAPSSWREGGVIKPGFSQEIDELRKLAFQGDQWLLEYEREEREKTGIKSLKLGYNKVFGYYLEVTKPNLAQVPANYIRKQTLVNAERFITDRLQEYENKVLRAKERLLQLEQETFNRVREELKRYIPEIKDTADKVGSLDALASLAEAAFTYDYARPKLKEEGCLVIKEGRHPVVERARREEGFVPNDTFLDPQGARIGLITGPNMGGKSTYLRQVALIAIMAQMGSFVPAAEAEIPIIDKVFTRVGASDDLARGRSTFMVEMSEVAYILRHATERSLVLLDEVGRGTSTFDGLSIAQALVEHLVQMPGLKVLFATHYHELTSLADKFPCIFNLCVAVKESGQDVVFLKKVIKGKADKSYGIHVAELAGIPAQVTKRAEEILQSLERSKGPETKVRPLQPSLFEDIEHPVIERLRLLDIDRLTPLEALNVLDELRQMLDKGQQRKRAATRSRNKI